ncbi:Hypothetical predicted protein [Cloeon dipterum]|uniref:Uncharacterized protein n=1 Tax=Cloeon dipterum TaxID=197152 RepID=A0A8S1BLR7_9INSE|nr:Hypothetical predicted protein [Cloeon dipterum]
MTRFCCLPILLILAAGCCVAQDQWRPVADRIPKPSVLRPRYSALSPVELLQRASAARVVPNPADALIPLIQPVQVIQIEEYPSTFVVAEPLPTVSAVLPSKIRQPPATKETRSYRKSYSTGRREQQTAAQKPKEQSANLKELLKQAGTLSLSEILQQKNLSLADFLQGKKTALTALKEQQSSENEVVTQKTVIEVVRTESTATSSTERPTTSTRYPEIVYRAPEEGAKRPNVYKAAHRTSYLKRSTTTPPPTYPEEDESERHWLSEDGEKSDSREDILELLQPGSPVSLAALLSSRNMTLAELMDHRERGSQQQSLTALFADLAKGVTTTRSPRVAESPKRKGKISRDPRLLDLPRRFTLPPEEVEEEEEQEDLARNHNKVSVDHYDYVEDEEEEEAPGLPTAVKSAILASGGLLGVALLLFAAIFVGCRTYQRRQRGSRTPFIINGKHIRTVIKPASNKAIEDPNDF